VKQVTSAEFSSGVMPRERFWRHFGWSSGALGEQGKREMGQPLQAWKAARSWRAGNDDRLWLSILIDAMEQASRPELRAKPCDGAVLAGLRAQLALPASIRFTSPFSLRN
jgi:hypothetical protein